MKIKITSDSTCDLSPEQIARYRAVTQRGHCGRSSWDEVVSRTLQLYQRK